MLPRRQRCERQLPGSLQLFAAAAAFAAAAPYVVGGGGNSDDEPWVSAKWFPVVKPLNASRAAVILGDYKLLQNAPAQPAFRPSENESACDCAAASWARHGARYIFNLADDPQEAHNLYDELRGGDVEAALVALLEEHYRAAREHSCAWRPATKEHAFGMWNRYEGFVGPWLDGGNSTYVANAKAQLAILNSSQS